MKQWPIATLLKEEEALSRQAENREINFRFWSSDRLKINCSHSRNYQNHQSKILACYLGIAPFEYRSVTRIKGRTRVSHLANKDLKKMLDMAALVTIRKGNIMHGYYKRKVTEGKNKMSVINAFRNKVIHILMACIKNDTLYQKNFNQSLEIT